eukprot:TRINITY_DN461_c0_g1_i1.p1 TRINITY_DN461_c0_g1~~TRINITY_DN461_c0_g1_i1.p1  ORF type:complete len:120 (+),score=6.95 TRINITY_DN461_c0_g1_i1:144-503(+)
MTALQLFLFSLFTIVSVYTGVVIRNHGLGLFPVYFGDMVAMNWRGQFNTDFSCFLLLSGAWTSWKNNYGIFGLSLGVVAVFGGAVFLLPYLLYLTSACNGDMKKVFLPWNYEKENSKAK